MFNLSVFLKVTVPKEILNMSFIQKATKPRHKIWDCFTEVREGNKVRGKCRCGATYVTHVDRMQRHILKQCKKIPENEKQKYKHVSLLYLTHLDKN